MIRSNLWSVILSCTVTLFVISCSVENSKKVKVSVTTTDRTVKNIKINLSDMLNFAPAMLSEAKIDSTGTATLEFNLPSPTFAYFELGERWVAVYLEPGYDLKVNLDTTRDNAILFSGKGAEPNNYIAQTAKIYKTYERKGGKFFWELTPLKFADRFDSLKIDFASFHSRYCDSTNLSKSTSRILELNNRLNLISIRQNFLLVNPKDSVNKDQFPEQLLIISKEIPFEDDLLKYRMPNYALVLQWYLDLDVYKPYRQGKKEIENINGLFPKIVNDSIVNDKKYTAGIKEFLVAKNIYRQMEFSGFTPVIDSLFNIFKQAHPASNYLPQLQIRADKWLAISPGRVAPDFTGTTIDGKSVSLKDLRGKVVYIDVWATWCAPCREELPFSNKIQKLFEQNDNVVFLFVSVDRDVEAWKKLVTNDKNLTGVQVIQQDEQIWKSYLITSVPRYILIDFEGKIVNSDASKPSSGKVENEIREQLEKIKS